jgi:hypothetical protein
MEYELYHHGILGMHWGIRRYQNKDGSLTAAGRKRYSNETDLSDDDTKIPERNKKYVEDSNKKANDLAAETYKNLNEDEAINVAVNRLREQLGGPDQVDDPELLELVLMEEGDLLKRAGFKSTEDMLANVEARFNTSLDDKKVAQSTENFFSDKSNKGKMSFDLRIENNPQCHALAERFMSGEFNRAIYQKILNETYDGYLDWCVQGNIRPVNRIDYIKGLRKAGFNSGGVTFFPRQGMASLDLYVNDNDYFWGHVFGLEITDKYGVQKDKVRLEG